jgi:branched-chain amino acid transport system ATP-binding protein
VSALSVAGLKARYGQSAVLHGIDLEVAPGTTTVVLGANGAGKTTLLRSICGMVEREGKIVWDGAPIDRLATDEIARRGVAHVPEGRGTFPNLTTDENLQIGGHARTDRSEVAASRERVYAWFPRLADRRRQKAGTLSGGEQQMLAIGRALMSKPRLILLDEPSFGLAPQVVRELYAILRDIQGAQRAAMLLVEQNAGQALELADRVYVFEAGRIALSGPPATIRDDASLRRAYLGY